MPRLAIVPLFLLLALAACNKPDARKPEPESGPVDPSDPPADTSVSLADARKAHKPARGTQRDGEPAPEPPAKLFRKMTYPSPAGNLSAYLTPDPGDGKKRPAIIWITGGDCNSIGDVWTPGKRGNDQTARQYREAGIVMMFPSLRGGNDNPGFKEGYYGEVDDVIAAADYLANKQYVDPTRIYLGGHSTGGTLVLLVAEMTDRFRAVFSFGPVDSPMRYGVGDFTPFDTTNPREVELRSPGRWLHSIKSPTFVFEGLTDGNALALAIMQNASKNPKAQFFTVRGADHFSVLAPVNGLIAQKILKDDGPATSLAFTGDELARVAGR